MLFCAFFLPFPRILGVPRREKPLLFSGFPLLFFKKGLEGQGSDFRIDGAKSPETPQKKRVFGLGNRNSKSQIASDFPSQTFHRTLKSQMQHCFVLSRKSLAISGVRDGHRNRKSQKSLQFRRAKVQNPDLLFLAFLENSKENYQKRQGFLLPAEPLKSLGKKGKTIKVARNSLKRRKARQTKKARKRRS